MFRTTRRSAAPGLGGGLNIRIIIGIVMALFALFSYFTSQEFNPVTNENQHLTLSPQQEIALGLQSAPELIAEFGGRYRDEQLQSQVSAIGRNLVNNSVARDLPWQFEFTVLDDPETINAFALPGGPVFITTALLSRLETEDEVAGVLSHEIVHVLARHSAQQIAKNDFTNGLIGAVTVASGDATASQTAAMIGQLVNMKYGREDETQSDTLGICLMMSAGYDPQAMVEVMRVLQEASGGGGQPEFLSSHPNPENRIGKIQDAIANPASCPALAPGANR